MKTHPLSGKIAWCIGLTQLINWGITFYLLGAFGDAIAHDTAWGQPLIFSGLTLAMVVMGLVSPVSGRLLALMGGRKVMQLGALLNGLDACSGNEPLSRYLLPGLAGNGHRHAPFAL